LCCAHLRPRLESFRRVRALTPDLVVYTGDFVSYETEIFRHAATHGGQCKPPFLPPPLLPVQNRRYTCGEFEIANERRLYISRGLGHLLQVRINVRPEITLFELESA
jgi:predicted MPP superfamily phosphohydrolase